MAFRKKINRRKSRGNFTRNALRTHRRNLLPATIMRGGYRL